MHFVALVTSLCLLLSGCSVAMAAKKSGHSIDEVQRSVTRSQILQLTEKTLSSERTSEGRLVETYSIRKESGSTARAIMHGVLDVSTLCVWEVIGTPMEGVLNKKEYLLIKVTYEKDDSRVEKIELQ